MKATSQITKSYFILFLFVLFQSLVSFAGNSNFTWTGNTSTSWNTNTNWSPNGVPSTNDSVTIVTASNSVLLANDVTVKRFTMISGTLNLNGKTLTISTLATFTSGTINNGNLKPNGSSTITFGGTTFGAIVNATGSTIYLNGSIFNDSLVITKNGNSNDNSKGGNHFYKYVSLTNSARGAFVLADSLPDTFEYPLKVSNTNEGTVYLAHKATNSVFNDNVTLYGKNIYSNYYGTASFNGNIIINCPAGGIYLGYSTGSATIANNKNISLGDSAFSSGSLYLRHITKTGTEPALTLTLTGTAKCYLEDGSIFNCGVNITAPSVYLEGSKFNKLTTIVNTGTATVTSAGGSYFADSASIKNNSSSTNTFTLGSTSPDTFAVSAYIQNLKGTLNINNALFTGKAYLKNIETATTDDRFIIANTGNVLFKDNILIENTYSGICFGKTSGTSVLESGKTLSFQSGLTGNVSLKYFTQQGGTSNSWEFSSASSKLILGPGTTFGGDLTYYGQQISLNGTTFNGSANISRYGSIPDTSAGGNIFNGTAIIQDSSNTSYPYFMAYASPDDFNGNVTFIQKGSGAILRPCYTKNSTFAGNVTINAASSFQIGTNGGKMIFDGSINQSLSNSTSNSISIKKLQINKASNSLTLNYPVTISDSLFLSKGRINTDSVNVMTIANGGKVSGGSDSAYINGPMKKIGNSAFIFPLGSTTLAYAYHPLEITAPSVSTDAYTANYLAQSQSLGSAMDTSVDNLNACQYWSLKRDAGNSMVKVKLSWNHDSCETISPLNFRVVSWVGNLWRDLGNSSYLGDSIVGEVLSGSTTSENYFTLAFHKCSNFRKTISHINVSCNGGSDGTGIILAEGGTANYTYSWANGFGMNSQARNLRAGKYKVQATDFRGCSLTDSLIISEPDIITMAISSSMATCHDSDGTIIVSPLGGIPPYTYFWSYNGSSASHINFVPSGIYDVTVRDSKGCIAIGQKMIEDSNGPAINILSKSNLLCYGGNTGSIEVDGADTHTPFSYKWNNSDQDTLPILDELKAGFYRIQVTDSDGCISEDTIEITQPDTFDLSLSVTPTPCDSSSGQIIATPVGGTLPLSYHWSGSSDTDSILTGLPAGLDTVAITDANNCALTRIVEVESSSGLTLTSEVLSNVICFPDSGGSARVIVSGGTSPYAFHWSNLSVNNDTALNLMSGTYLVTVIDANGCRKKTEIEISGPQQLRSNIDFFNPSADSAFDGLIIANPTGGTPPYSFHWTDSIFSNELSGLGPGEYNSIIVDQNGCSVRSAINLTVPTQLCHNCSSVQIDNCYDPGLSTCSSCTTPVTVDITTFGGDGSDELSDHCAFQEAAKYLSQQNPLAEKILTIPPGTYYVGKQETVDHWLLRGSSALCFENIDHVRIIGDPLGTGSKPIIKMENCLKYGAFVNDPNSSADGDRFLSEFPGRPITCLVSGNVCNVSSTAFIQAGDNIYDPNLSHTLIGPHGQVVKWFVPTQVDQILSGTQFTIIIPANAPLFTTMDLILQTDCHVNDVNYSNIAEVGDIIHLNGCNDARITNLELDGNIDNAVIGGGYLLDGIQVAYDGIFINACDALRLRNLDIHHFGHDGIYLIYDECPNPLVMINHDMDCEFRNLKVQYNGRNALSWGGGKDLRIYDSEFNLSGQSRLVSQPGAGLDIEFENSNNPNAYGYFKRTKFKYNKYHGVICAAAESNPSTDHICRDYTFDECTFVGAEHGDALWPNSRNFTFNHGSEVYGKALKAYSVVASSLADPLFNDNTKFSDCNFYEEFNETDLSMPAQFQGNHYFSFNPDETELVGGVWQPTLCTSVQPHSPLIDFSLDNRVFMTNCNVFTNFTNSIIYLGGYGNYQQDYNRNRIENCDFWNAGMNFKINILDINNNCTCDRVLLSIANTNFYGTNVAYSINQVRPFPSAGECTDASWVYYENPEWNSCGASNPPNFYYDYAGVLTGTYGLQTVSSGNLTGKFKDLIDPHTVMPLLSSPCTSIPIGYPSICSPQQLFRLTSKADEQTISLIATPNPFNSIVIIDNLIPNQAFQVIDIAGSVILEKVVSESRVSLNLEFLRSGIYFIKTYNRFPVRIIKM